MPWIEKEFDPEFRQYILDFPKDRFPKIYELIKQYQDTRRIIIFIPERKPKAGLIQYSKFPLV